MQHQNFAWKNMTLGVCYYPEHWPETFWPDDLRRMRDVGISTVRIAEFAWNKVEPEEGVFSYEFFDRFLDLCAGEGMKVIFGTPTATPPAWLTEKYPEVLNAREDGVLYRHGARRHYNYNSPKYLELSARIVERIARHYAGHEAIVGWQIDNELNCEVNEYYSQADDAAFRVFLKEKYLTLDALNDAWGAAFWNQTYTDWGQVHLPRPILNRGYNPHMYLDYVRFISQSTLAYCRMQADIIRKYKKPEDFITTNGIFGNMDNHRMFRESLDVYTYDSYPDFAFDLQHDPASSEDLNDRHWSKNLAEVRSVCPHFGIMEQQSGANGWVTRMEAPAPRPGQLTLWAMQSVAHGADYISFFRWRTCTFGTEMYWHGILDYDNRDNRKLSEVKEFYRKFRKLDALCGAEFTAAFGILKDYDNIWDAQLDVWHQRVAKPSEEAIFLAAQLTHTPYDVIYLGEDSAPDGLAAYPVLFYPHPVIMTRERAQILKEYVCQGGTLIIGCRSGYKQENGKCVMMPQPGLLRELTGSDVTDFTFAIPSAAPVSADWDGVKIETPVFRDIMEPAEDAAHARVLAVYMDEYYAGKAALIENAAGEGRTIHFGSVFSKETVVRLLEYTGVINPFQDVIEAPPEIELVQREKNGRRFLFALNYMPSPQKIFLKRAMRSVFEETQEAGEVKLAPYEVKVYEV